MTSSHIASKRPLVALLGLALLFVGDSLALAGPLRIKFATLAPDGTVWAKALRETDREIRTETGGAVRLKIYPGGSQGDEKDMVRKMRLGQLHAAGITGIGLADILPSIHVLDLPFLFETYDEVDAVLEVVQPFYEAAFEEKGFKLLGFTEAGFVRFFSDRPLSSPEDFAAPGVKAWTWEGDLLSQELYRAFGINPIPLALPDVLTGLQTGMINTTYAPPAGAVALQWHSRLSYIGPVDMAWASGGIVVTMRQWKKLSADQQQIVGQAFAALSRRLRDLTRQDNRNALEAMTRQGMKIVAMPSDEALASYRRIAGEVRERLVGKLYTREELQRVLDALAAYRSRGAAEASAANVAPTN